MTTEITKQYIEENLLTKILGLNSNKTGLLKETKEELYLIYHNLKETPTCKCGEYTFFLGFNKGYRKFCSRKCSTNSVEVKEKTKMSMLDVYGVEYPMQSKEIKNKSKQTVLEKYDVENISQVDEIKQKKIETTRKHYNVDNPFQSEIIKEQMKVTNLKNLGVEYPAQAGINATGFKHKPYTFPSGKISPVQGYEPKLLDELVLIYEENEILTDRKDMPEFWYFTEDNKEHRYFPDVYIPKDNLIYEVKSEWTLEQEKKKGTYNLKKQSVIDAGFKFILKIY